MFMDLIYGVRDFFMGPSIDEKRLVVRVRCDVSVGCQTQQGGRVCALKDLSALGARLATDDNWRKGMKVQLMPPKGMEGENKPIKAVVMWSRPMSGKYQVGLKFQAKAQRTWVGVMLKELGLSTNIPKQQRKFIRFPSNYAVKYTVHGGEKAAVLKNLSMGGALLSTSSRLARDVPVQLYLPASKLAPALRVVGRVCGMKQLQSSFEIPIQFDSLSSEQEKGLLKHLKTLMDENRSK
jgi:hypothetical protein